MGGKPASPVISSLHAKLAADTRQGNDTTDTRRALATAKVEQYIQKTLAAAPPLTREQRDRLSGLLRSESS